MLLYCCCTLTPSTAVCLCHLSNLSFIYYALAHRLHIVCAMSVVQLVRPISLPRCVTLFAITKTSACRSLQSVVIVSMQKLFFYDSSEVFYYFFGNDKRFQSPRERRCVGMLGDDWYRRKCTTVSYILTLSWVFLCVMPCIIISAICINDYGALKSRHRMLWTKFMTWSERHDSNEIAGRFPSLWAAVTTLGPACWIDDCLWIGWRRCSEGTWSLIAGVHLLFSFYLR